MLKKMFLLGNLGLLFMSPVVAADEVTVLGRAPTSVIDLNTGRHPVTLLADKDKEEDEQRKKDEKELDKAVAEVESSKGDDKPSNYARFLTSGGDDLVAAKAGNLAAVLSFPDQPSLIFNNAKDQVSIGSKTSKKTLDINYNSLRKIKYPVSTEDGVTYGETGSLYGYATYGKAITELGLMSTGGITVMETLAAWLLLIAYFASLLVPSAFMLALWFLDFFNPFRWFDSLMGFVSGQVSLGSVPPALRIIATPVIDLYNGVKDIALSVYFPVLLGVAVAMLFFGNGRKGVALIKSFWIKLAISTLGLFMLGSLYTEALGFMKTQAVNLNGMGSYADYLVTSTFVQSADWVRHTRLAVPDQNGNLSGNASTSIILYNDKKGVGVMNADSFRRGVASLNYFIAKRKGDADDIAATQAAMEQFTTGNKGSINKVVLDVDSGNHIKSTENRFTFDVKGLIDNPSRAYAYNTIRTYLAAGNIYNAADYEGDLRSAFDGSVRDRAILNGLLSFEMKDVPAIVDLLAKGGASYDFEFNKESKRSFFGKAITVAPGNIYNNGSLSSSGKADTNGLIGYAITGGDIKVDGLDPTAHISNGGINGFGLSDMAMYNFLASEFNEKGMRVHYMPKSNSYQTAVNYKSVSLAGRGYHGFLTLVEDVLVLGGLAIIGYTIVFYLMLRVGTFTFTMIPHIVTTNFGSAKGFVHLAGIGFSVVAYVFISFVAYNLVAELFIVLVEVASTFGNGSIDFGLIFVG